MTDDMICDLNTRSRNAVRDALPDQILINGSIYNTVGGLLRMPQSIYHSKDAFLLTEVIENNP